MFSDDKKKTQGAWTRKKGQTLGERTVIFNFFAPEANAAHVAGEFNGWDANSLPMKKQKDGTWKAEVKLSPGRYEYKFIVDGIWFEDLPGVERTSNQYGTQNFVMQVS